MQKFLLKNERMLIMSPRDAHKMNIIINEVLGILFALFSLLSDSIKIPFHCH